MQRPGFSILLLIGILSIPVSALAGLGLAKDSVIRDMQSSKVAAKTTDSDDYSTYEFELNGATIRECLSTDGKVFALSWKNAPRRPPLSDLLGPYFAEFDANDPAKNRQAGGRVTHVVKTANLEVHAGGHMRAFEGKAFVQKYIPTPGAEVECLK
jgi:hypothetical protein